MPNLLEELAIAKAKESTALDTEEAIIKRRRKAAIATRKKQSEIHNATSFLIGKTIVNARASDDLTPEELKALAGLLDRLVKDNYPRQLLGDFLTTPAQKPRDYDELRQAGK